MPSTTLDYFIVNLGTDRLATLIADTYQTWSSGRIIKQKQWDELRSYLFATDTTTTTNKQLPWKNKTTRPKLTQIRDNLQANYIAALFPTERWFKWVPDDLAGAAVDKSTAIEAYVLHKLRESGFKQTITKHVNDYIDYGNCIGDVEFCNETFTLADSPNLLPVYVGPRLLRISPMDIVFDLGASSFEQSPKITRTLLSFGQIEKLRRTNPDWSQIGEDALAAIKDNRKNAIGNSRIFSDGDQSRLQAYVADGFSSLLQYYNSGMVEFLEFEGDLYDISTGELLENHVITIMDRIKVIRKEPIKNWFGRSYKRHVGWRLRPDNLMAMGPLDNLVGLQYRLDHLENLKADVFDMISTPPLKIKGYVEAFQWGPNEKIFMEQDADVESLAPSPIALNADMQIERIERTMDEMAGAPKDAMGIRTPGEKTAFEVNALVTAASRIFQNKAAQFEESFLEPLLNAFLEIGRRNLNSPETVKVVDNETGITQFMTITPEDLQARGKLVPMGARHFAAQQQIIQNLNSLAASGLYQDPDIRNHLSGKQIAKLIEENLNLERFGLYQPNVRILEQMETAKLTQIAQEELQVAQATPVQTTQDAQDLNEADMQNQQASQSPIQG